MAMVLNNSGQRLKIKGVSIGPREMANVDLSSSELRNHLFVRSGLLDVSKGTNGTTAGKRKAQEPESTEE